MMRQKYYAVHKGRLPGVYPTWLECKTQTHRFSNAVFKAFYNPLDADLFVTNGPAVGVEKEYTLWPGRS